MTDLSPDFGPCVGHRGVRRSSYGNWSVTGDVSARSSNARRSYQRRPVGGKRNCDVANRRARDAPPPGDGEANIIGGGLTESAQFASTFSLASPDVISPGLTSVLQWRQHRQRRTRYVTSRSQRTSRSDLVLLWTRSGRSGWWAKTADRFHLGAATCQQRQTAPLIIIDYDVTANARDAASYTWAIGVFLFEGGGNLHI